MNTSSMTIKSLIIDDNPLNIVILSDLLEANHPEVEVVGTAHNGTTAIEKIQALQPELIFLDVEMPDMNGFEVLAALKVLNFQTIFVTAHSHYAIQAIRFNALDYLVKPIDPKELRQSLKRYRSQGNGQVQQQKITLALDNLQQERVQDQVLFLPTQEGGIKMILRDIIKVEGDRNYSTFHLVHGKTKISSKTLGHFEERLKDKGFFRCHRSFLVNRHHIDTLQKDYFVLKDRSQIPISRRRKTEAKAWFVL